MCSICGQTPCLGQCPNAPDPPAVYVCAYCGEPIVQGEEFLELDDDYYHLDDCSGNVAMYLLLNKCGASKGVAEVVGTWE